jgi:hypothetical protein
MESTSKAGMMEVGLLVLGCGGAVNLECLQWCGAETGPCKRKLNTNNESRIHMLRSCTSLGGGIS